MGVGYRAVMSLFCEGPQRPSGEGFAICSKRTRWVTWPDINAPPRIRGDSEATQEPYLGWAPTGPPGTYTRP